MENETIQSLVKANDVAQWNNLVTTNKSILLEILARRKALWNWCKQDLGNQAIAQEMSTRDIIYWANNWVYGYDPRNLPERAAEIPIILFGKQEEFLHWIEDRMTHREHGLVEKCRDSGATFLCCIFAVHGWLYQAGFKATFGSRKEDLVDKSDDPDSIFEKIRAIIYHLPVWMLPKGFSRDKHDKFMRIKNPDTGAVITGECGDNMGRGGRATIYFKDEAAFLAHPESIEAAVSGNSNVVIDISTPKGTGNPFAKKRQSGQVPVFSFNWKDDPRKSREWYEKKKRLLDAIIFAQEIDVSYTASDDDILIPAEWVQAAIALYKKIPDYYFHIAKRCQKIAGLDVADSGGNKNVYTIKQSIFVKTILSWANTNTTQTAYRAIQISNHNKIDKLFFDRIGVGAGVHGILESQAYDEYEYIENDAPNINLKALFEFEGFNAQDKCSDTVWETLGDRKAKEIFANARAEAAWILRTKFEKTFEFVEKNIEHHLDNLICIIPTLIEATSSVQSQMFGGYDFYGNAATDNINFLIQQLSQPKFCFSDRGLIRVESKKEMKSRGIESPDYFDSLVLACLDEQYGFDAIEAMTKD